MDKRLGALVMAYGVFLVLCGIIGYNITSATSTSSLFNGALFGVLVILLGMFRRQGRMWTHPASVSASAIFTLTFVWRASVQWYNAEHGDPNRFGIAVLLSVMAVVSAATLIVLLRYYRH